jgi:putative transposase
VITIDQIGAGKETTKIYNKRSLTNIRPRQCKYWNNRVEADHRFIKWRIQYNLGFKNFESASRILSGIEMVRMIKKNQLVSPMATPYKTFCSLAA